MKIGFDYSGIFYVDGMIDTPKLKKIPFQYFFENLSFPEDRILYNVYTDCNIGQCKKLIVKYGKIERCQ